MTLKDLLVHVLSSFSHMKTRLLWASVEGSIDLSAKLVNVKSCFSSSSFPFPIFFVCTLTGWSLSEKSGESQGKLKMVKIVREKSWNLRIKRKFMVK